MHRKRWVRNYTKSHYYHPKVRKFLFVVSSCCRAWVGDGTTNLDAATLVVHVSTYLFGYVLQVVFLFQSYLSEFYFFNTYKCVCSNQHFDFCNVWWKSIELAQCNIALPHKIYIRSRKWLLYFSVEVDLISSSSFFNTSNVDFSLSFELRICLKAPLHYSQMFARRVRKRIIFYILHQIRFTVWSFLIRNRWTIRAVRLLPIVYLSLCVKHRFSIKILTAPLRGQTAIWQ